MIKDIKEKLAKATAPSQNAKDDPVINELQEKLKNLDAKDKALNKKTDTEQLKDLVEHNDVQLEDAIDADTPIDHSQTLFQKKQSMFMQEPEILLQDEKITNLVMNQIKELITINNNLSRQLADINNRLITDEKEIATIKTKIDKSDEKMLAIDTRLEKFLGLYEIVTNQFNPFVEQHQNDDDMPIVSETKKEQHNEKEIEKKVEIKEEEKNEKSHETFYQELLDNINNKIAVMLTDFKKNMDQTIDNSVNQKLSTTLEFLDEALEEEISHAIKKEMENVKIDHQKIDALLTQLQEFHIAKEKIATFSDNVHTLEKEIDTIEVKENKQKEQKDILNVKAHQEKAFELEQGMKLTTLNDLLTYLEQVEISIFQKHVNAEKNDFASWVEHVFSFEELAKNMKNCDTPQKMIIAVQDFVKNNKN